MPPCKRATTPLLMILSMALLLLGCQSDSASSVQGESDAGGDVTAMSPSSDVWESSADHDGPAPVDTSDVGVDTAMFPDLTPGVPHFDDASIVGVGPCANSADLEALNGLDPAVDLLTLGMSCMKPQTGRPGTDEEEAELVACLVSHLGSDFGFSQGCGVCVAGHVVCAQESCMDKCMSFMLAGVISDTCAECIDNSGCKDEFASCSGVDPDVMRPDG